MKRAQELRDQVVELRIEERELVEAQNAVAEKLAANRAEQERLKRLLVTDAQTSMRLQSVTSKESARGTLARLGVFTASEAQAELGWERPRLKKLMDAMLCEKPPTLVLDGKLGTQKMYRYAGPAIEEVDPIAERTAAALEALREWVLERTQPFTPAQAGAAIEVPRATALRALRQLADIGVIVDEGPTADHPLFVLSGEHAPDVALAPPGLTVVAEPEPMSDIPVIQELLAAAQRAGAEINASNGHFSIEALDGRRVIIPSKPRGRSQMLQDKARLRRIGIEV